MKLTTKKHKLGLILTAFLLSGVTICTTDYIDRQRNIKDVKAELKALSVIEEKKVAKTIVVKSDGIKYKDSFIPKVDKEMRIMTVRLTVYWARGGDTDSYSAKLKSSTGRTLKQGESIAVDPRIIPYNKEVIIPNIGLVKAVDTGTAVKQKRASNGKLPVIDVFFYNKKDAMLFANRYPKVVKVAVLN